MPGLTVALAQSTIPAIEGIETPEMRLVSTFLILFLVGVGGYAGVPRVCRWLVHTVDDAVPSLEYIDRYDTVVEQYVSSEFDAVRWLTVTVQAAVTIFGATILLFVWGESQSAILFLTFIVQAFPEIGRITGTVLVVVAAYLGSVAIDRGLERIADSDRWDDHQAGIVFRTTQVLMFISLGLVVLSIWNVNIGGLIVGAGFLGIVVGMATRQTIAALVAGFVMMLSRPFEIGDWIEVGDEEGFVEDITIVNTRIENLDGEVVVIPNDTIGNKMLKNKSRKGRLRITMEVTISYDDDPAEAADVAENAIRQIDEVMTVPNPKAIPKRFGDSGVVIELRFWIDNPNAQRRARAKAAAISEIKAGFDQNGIKIPYPHRELRIQSDNTDSGTSHESRDLTEFGET